MKNILITIALIFATTPFFAQVQAIDEFYAKHKRGKEVVSLNLPGFLIRLGASIAKFDDINHSSSERAALELMKDVRKAKVLAGEGLYIERAEIKQLLNDLTDEGFEELMMVRSEDSDVNIIIREKKNWIRNIVLIVNDGGEFAIISLKTRLHLDDLSYLINQSMEG